MILHESFTKINILSPSLAQTEQVPCLCVEGLLIITTHPEATIYEKNHMEHETIVEAKTSETEAQAQDLQNALESGDKDIQFPATGEKGWGNPPSPTPI